jgi:mRNA-degrading endonuclease HigB of HigAB toxin-antitoxin module
VAAGASGSPGSEDLGTRVSWLSIKGNDYRLIVAVAYRQRVPYIKFVGTHAEYDSIDAATVERD